MPAHFSTGQCKIHGSLIVATGEKTTDDEIKRKSGIYIIIHSSTEKGGGVISGKPIGVWFEKPYIYEYHLKSVLRVVSIRRAMSFRKHTPDMLKRLLS